MASDFHTVKAHVVTELGSVIALPLLETNETYIFSFLGHC